MPDHIRERSSDLESTSSSSGCSDDSYDCSMDHQSSSSSETISLNPKQRIIRSKKTRKKGGIPFSDRSNPSSQYRKKRRMEEDKKRRNQQRREVKGHPPMGLNQPHSSSEFHPDILGYLRSKGLSEQKLLELQFPGQVSNRDRYAERLKRSRSYFVNQPNYKVQNDRHPEDLPYSSQRKHSQIRNIYTSNSDQTHSRSRLTIADSSSVSGSVLSSSRSTTMRLNSSNRDSLSSNSSSGITSDESGIIDDSHHQRPHSRRDRSVSSLDEHSLRQGRHPHSERLNTLMEKPEMKRRRNYVRKNMRKGMLDDPDWSPEKAREDWKRHLNNKDQKMFDVYKSSLSNFAAVKGKSTRKGKGKNISQMRMRKGREGNMGGDNGINHRQYSLHEMKEELRMKQKQKQLSDHRINQVRISIPKPKQVLRTSMSHSELSADQDGRIRRKRVHLPEISDEDRNHFVDYHWTPKRKHPPMTKNYHQPSSSQRRSRQTQESKKKRFRRRHGTRRDTTVDYRKAKLPNNNTGIRSDDQTSINMEEQTHSERIPGFRRDRLKRIKERANDKQTTQLRSEELPKKIEEQSSPKRRRKGGILAISKQREDEIFDRIAQEKELEKSSKRDERKRDEQDWREEIDIEVSNLRRNAWVSPVLNGTVIRPVPAIRPPGLNELIKSTQDFPFIKKDQSTEKDDNDEDDGDLTAENIIQSGFYNETIDIPSTWRVRDNSGEYSSVTYHRIIASELLQTRDDDCQRNNSEMDKNQGITPMLMEDGTEQEMTEPIRLPTVLPPDGDDILQYIRKQCVMELEQQPKPVPQIRSKMWSEDRLFSSDVSHLIPIESDHSFKEPQKPCLQEFDPSELGWVSIPAIKVKPGVIPVPDSKTENKNISENKLHQKPEELEPSHRAMITDEGSKDEMKMQNKLSLSKNKKVKPQTKGKKKKRTKRRVRKNEREEEELEPSPIMGYTPNPYMFGHGGYGYPGPCGYPSYHPTDPGLYYPNQYIVEEDYLSDEVEDEEEEEEEEEDESVESDKNDDDNDKDSNNSLIQESKERAEENRLMRVLDKYLGPLRTQLTEKQLEHVSQASSNASEHVSAPKVDSVLTQPIPPQMKNNGFNTVNQTSPPGASEPAQFGSHPSDMSILQRPDVQSQNKFWNGQNPFQTAMNTRNQTMLNVTGMPTIVGSPTVSVYQPASSFLYPQMPQSNPQSHLASIPSVTPSHIIQTLPTMELRPSAAQMAAVYGPSSNHQNNEIQIKEMIIKAKNNEHRAVERLLISGVSANATDDFGNTIIHIGCQNGSKKMVKVGLKFHCGVNEQNHDGQTGLHFAYTYGYVDLAKYLISKGAKDTILNKSGLTCYDGLRPKEQSNTLMESNT